MAPTSSGPNANKDGGDERRSLGGRLEALPHQDEDYAERARYPEQKEMADARPEHHSPSPAPVGRSERGLGALRMLRSRCYVVSGGGA